MKGNTRRRIIRSLFDQWAIQNVKHVTPVEGEKHLFAINGKSQGIFLVFNDRSKKSVLDRKAFKEIAAEAGRHGLEAKWHVYGSVCTYSGPGLEFYQPN